MNRSFFLLWICLPVFYAQDLPERKCSDDCLVCIAGTCMESRCNDQCLQDGSCQGSVCLNGCPFGRYGQSCSYECVCHNGCNQDDGKCIKSNSGGGYEAPVDNSRLWNILKIVGGIVGGVVVLAVISAYCRSRGILDNQRSRNTHSTDYTPPPQPSPIREYGYRYGAGTGTTSQRTGGNDDFWDTESDCGATIPDACNVSHSQNRAGYSPRSRSDNPTSVIMTESVGRADQISRSEIGSSAYRPPGWRSGSRTSEQEPLNVPQAPLAPSAPVPPSAPTQPLPTSPPPPPPTDLQELPPAYSSLFPDGSKAEK